MTTRIWKDGDTFSIFTDCDTEVRFLDELADIWSSLINAGVHAGDWEFQFSNLLPLIVDICVAYRGYKNDVSKKTVFVHGNGLGQMGPPDYEYIPGQGVQINHPIEGRNK